MGAASVSLILFFCEESEGGREREGGREKEQGREGGREGSRDGKGGERERRGELGQAKLIIKHTASN